MSVFFADPAVLPNQYPKTVPNTVDKDPNRSTLICESYITAAPDRIKASIAVYPIVTTKDMMARTTSFKFFIFISPKFYWTMLFDL